MKGIHGGDIYRNRVNADFSVSINPLGMHEDVEKALQRAINRCQEYPDIEAQRLRQAVSSMLNVPGEYLLFGNGASELFMGIVHALRPKKTLIPVPSFYGYEYAADAAGGEIIYYFLNEKEQFALSEDFIEALEDDIDILFLANPNNPTGKRIDGEYLRKLLKVCGEKKIYVVLDECFIEFCGREFSMLSKLREYPNLIIVRAFTKTYGIPGVRLGYLACSNLSLSERIRKQLPEWNISTFAQETGMACVIQTEYVKKTVEYVKKERSFLTKNLEKQGIHVFASEANFVLVHSEKPLYEMLLKRGILIRNCTNFRGLSEGYYRIAVKQRKDNQKLLKVIGECIE